MNDKFDLDKEQQAVLDSSEAFYTGLTIAALEGVFARMPFGQTFTIKDGRTCTVKPFVEPRVNAKTLMPEFGFDVKGDGWHLEFFVQRTGWGGVPLSGSSQKTN